MVVGAVVRRAASENLVQKECGGTACRGSRHELHRVAHVCPTSEEEDGRRTKDICFRFPIMARWVRFLAPRPWM